MRVRVSPSTPNTINTDMRLYELRKRHPVDQELPYDPNAQEYHKTRGNKWAGPHEGRLLTLMLKGLKPAAIVSADELSNFMPYVEDGTFVSGPINGSFHGATIVSLPDEAWRIDRIENLYKQRNKYFEAGKKALYHARLGILLGYANEDIKRFLED